MGRMRKVLSVLGAFVLLAGIGTAAWSIFLMDSFTGYVTSTEGQPITLLSGFDDVSLDTTTAAATQTTSNNIKNENGNISVTFNANVSKTDIVDDCIDFEGDCDVAFEYSNAGGSGALQDGDEIILTSGFTTVESIVTCQRLSCPQNIEAEIIFTQ